MVVLCHYSRWNLSNLTLSFALCKRTLNGAIPVAGTLRQHESLPGLPVGVRGLAAGPVEMWSRILPYVHLVVGRVEHNMPLL